MKIHNLLSDKRLLFRLARDLLLLCLGLFAVHYWQARSLVEPGEALPNVILPSLDGDSRALILKGKPALIYVFAPWCGVCKLSIGNAQDFYNADSKRQVNVVLLAQDYSSVAEVREFLIEQQLSVPVLLGNAVSKRALNVQAYPTYYLLDEDQQVRFRSVGYSSEWGLKARNWLLELDLFGAE